LNHLVLPWTNFSNCGYHIKVAYSEIEYKSTLWCICHKTVSYQPCSEYTKNVW